MVQNTGDGCLHVAAHPKQETIEVSWLCAADALTVPGRLRTAPCRVAERKVVARGHARLDSPPPASPYWHALLPLEWVALGVRVDCPDCVFEHDFLERAVEMRCRVTEFVEADGRATAGARRYAARHRAVRLPFVDTSVVHRMYSELPGGYVVLAEGL